jgi:hypothetical protein
VSDEERRRSVAEKPARPFVDSFVDSQRFYNAGYAAGRRALAAELTVLIDGMGDRGDHEFGWKAPLRDLTRRAARR